MPAPLSRRTFLLSTALGASGLAVGQVRAEPARRAPPSERLRVGAIGIAGQGGSDLNNIAAAGAEIVALCDVDTQRKEVLANKARYPRARFHTDFRRLIDTKGIDAVMVGTPDHSHAIPTLTALRAGLHAFCEKPLTHTVEEARLVAETAAKMKRVTQMGTQIHASDNYRRVVELIRANVIGPVSEVHVWCGKSWGGNGRRPAGTPPVPAGLDWDLWLGAAAERPYSPSYVPFNWRRYWAFGGGTLNDMACHYMDLPFWALDLRHPTRVAANGPPPTAETAALELTVNYDFPARGGRPALKLSWYDGGRKPAQLSRPGMPRWGDGVLFVGARGMLLADYGRWKLLPEADFVGVTPSRTIRGSIGHYKEWVEACKTGGRTTCNFDYSGALSETVLLGTVAYRLGKPINWDATTLRATGEPGADRFIRKEYRRPWKLT